MAEKLKVQQDQQFKIKIWGPPPREPDSDDLQKVTGFGDLTPYGMLLLSLAECTGVVVLTYAQHHDVDLKQVEFLVVYDRDFEDDCENCEEIDDYDEKIELSISLKGDFDSDQREKLFEIAKQCSIHKMLTNGITTDFVLRDEID